MKERPPAIQRFYRGTKLYDIVFHDGVRAFDLEEHTLKSHCWEFVDGIAPIEEIEVLLAKSASARLQHHEKELKNVFK